MSNAASQEVQEANLLLMDSVAGVGYSYSLNDSDYTTSDSQAQIDMEATLRTWFQLYPYFANHTVFLQGESYSGVYVPLLGKAIINGNEDGASPYIHLEGYLIGNGATDSSTDNINIFTLYSHWPLLPQSLADSLTASNCGTLSNPIVNTCTDLLNDVNNLISYNVNSLKWTGDCFYGLEAFIEALTDQISQQLAAEGTKFNQSLAGSGAGAAGSSGNAGCNYDERAAHVYFNRADVREALHVQPVQDEAGLWLNVNSQVSTVYTYDVTSVIPSHQLLISQGKSWVRALMYSGDLDWQVPWTGTQYWTSQMGASLGLLADWQPWFRPDPLNYGSQLSGYITQYQGLSFMTFKAAGHRVLQDTPADAYIMFTNFIDDTLNATTTYADFNNGGQSSIGIQ
ncbi:MAG: serine carboxypeptidase-like 20-like [Trebouxia sp. A1-2]|nr:MAG: serine carboxypeptidase-like 20-like [Trebouxia sp. A1-2]